MRRAWEIEQRAGDLAGQVARTPSGSVSQGEATPDLTMQALSESLGEIARQTRRAAERIRAASSEPAGAREDPLLRDLDRMTIRLERAAASTDSALGILERCQQRVTARLGS